MREFARWRGFAAGRDDAWHVEALRYVMSGAHDAWSPVLDARGEGSARIPVRGATRVVLLVQNTPDADYFERAAHPLTPELELLQ